LLLEKRPETENKIDPLSRQYRLIRLGVMNGDIGEFHTNAGKDDKFNAMNVDFPSQALLELLEDKVLEIVFAGQFSGERKKDSDHHHEGKDDHKRKPKTGHTTPSEHVSVVLGILPDRSV
jgi:hypothetical protein